MYGDGRTRHIYIYIVGERERANRLATIFLYIYNETAHILHLRMHRIYVKRLRGMCTLCPLSEFEARRHHGCLSRCGERRRVGDTSVQAPTLEIHRKQRLPTDTAEETETRLGACPSAVLESRIHAFMFILSTFCYNRFSSVILMHGKNQQVWICRVQIR